MEQTKNPGDVAASLPDKESPYDNIIILVANKSILEPLTAIKDAAAHARGHLYDVGMMRCATGTYLNLYFSGRDDVVNPFAIDKNAVPDTVSIPQSVALKLMANICLIAKTAMYSECGAELEKYLTNNAVGGSAR